MSFKRESANELPVQVFFQLSMTAPQVQHAACESGALLQPSEWLPVCHYVYPLMQQLHPEDELTLDAAVLHAGHMKM